MPDQSRYYDQFGILHSQAIISCPQPELWTTDYFEQGRIFKEIKSRIQKQEEFISKYFNTASAVLDLGCGFGRQAIILARNGYPVTGTDTSPVFIEIARKLFDRLNLKGDFFKYDILKSEWSAGKFNQLILFDVLEHIPPGKRKLFFKKMNEMMEPGAILLISVPHVKKRISSRLNNQIRKNITMHIPWFFRKEEHPYPIPSPKQIYQLTGNDFKVKEFEESADSDYYVMQKTS